MDRHALVVGGTGMLRGVSTQLASAGWQVTVVARRHAPLAALAQAAPGSIHPAPADYSDIASLAATVRAAGVARGRFSLVVCYVHSSAPLAPIVVADVVGDRAQPIPYIHIVGSASPDDLRLDATRDEIRSMPGIRYRRLILGFIIEDRSTRWLSDEEICRGVIGAMDDDAPEQVVGVVSPWERHPPL